MNTNRARRRTVDTSDYIDTHGKQPQGYGSWIFTDGTRQHDATGYYADVRAQLPAGHWTLLP
ncbi:hypothetical protein [Amycolatopsis thermophila]|uniref:Uncharacterized protein n=1 Tax=Amycolatopsis thermophila TaxID=206084 RepID=A0ABU0EMQ9_9PSEU|nr:hypothetical protein [Amycolatopsis thermophila]MDQ0376560.1 hypothetical protein [Amycolatopsis thermophila]